MSLIHIFENRLYDLNASLSSSGIGRDYQAGISKASALALCGAYPLPKIGCEVVGAVALGHRLFVQNLSGDYYVACSTAKADAWPTVFGVELRRFLPTAANAETVNMSH